jgi:hypothetical protein
LASLGIAPVEERWMKLTIRTLSAAGLLVALTTLGAATPAAAGGTTTLSVTKVIDGEAPVDAEYVVDVSCNLDPGSLTFTPTDLGPKETFLNISSTCEIGESATGGATGVAYTCDFTPAAADGGTIESCTVSGQGVAIVFGDGGGDTSVDVTVVNTYTPPAPGPAPAADVVEAQPAFTG